MSKYWCCWQSTESGLLFFVSPKEETSRNPAIGGAYGLWQARDPCAIRRAIRPCPIPCHLTPWPGHRTTTRFKRQPAAPIRAHHSIAKDSDHNAGNGERCRVHVFEAFASTAIKTVGLYVGDPSKPRMSGWCVPSLPMATHKRTQSRKKEGRKNAQGGKRRPGEENPPGEETTPKKMPARAADTRPV